MYKSCSGADLQVVEHIHEVDVRVVRRVVRREVLVHISISPILRAHVVQMIARRQLAPVFEDVRIASRVASRSSRVSVRISRGRQHAPIAMPSPTQFTSDRQRHWIPTSSDFACFIRSLAMRR